MDRKTGSFNVIDSTGKKHRIDEYHDVMASGVLGMLHHLMGDGRKVTNLGDGRFAIDATQEILIMAQKPEPEGA